ncbi:hypothetical protein FTX61_15175 [Nitriliruptoraceae bacterium ZYF776]|nr:hypothetical protein [Profundirhabdus halotolerans]
MPTAASSASEPVGDGERDPFAPLEASPRGAGVLTVLALACAAAAVFTGLAPVIGPLGMVLGVVAHAKGGRFGMHAAVTSGIATIVGFTLVFLLR